MERDIQTLTEKLCIIITKIYMLNKTHISWFVNIAPVFMLLTEDSIRQRLLDDIHIHLFSVVLFDHVSTAFELCSILIPKVDVFEAIPVGTLDILKIGP